MHLYLYNADRAENQNLVSALSITINKILCQFFEFTQNLKRSHKAQELDKDTDLPISGTLAYPLPIANEVNPLLIPIPEGVAEVI